MITRASTDTGRNSRSEGGHVPINGTQYVQACIDRAAVFGFCSLWLARWDATWASVSKAFASRGQI